VPSRSASRYFLACLAVLLAVPLRLALDALFERSLPYLPFLIAIALVSWLLGLVPALLALALSAAVLPVLPYWTPVRFVAFVILSVVTTLMIDFVHRTRNAAHDASAELARQQASIRRAELTQAELAAIIASSDDAIVGKDLNAIVTSWNRGAERLYGYAAAEMVGQPILRIIPPERLAEEDTVLSRIRAGHRVDNFDTERLRKDGTTIEVSVTVSPIRDSSGAIVGASKIARDISERSRNDRLREELLTRERLAREEAIGARDRLAFLAEISAVLTSSLDYAETVDRAVHLALPRLGDYSTVLVQDEHGQLKYVASGHVVPALEPTLRQLAVRLVEGTAHTEVPTNAEAVMKSGKTMLVSHEMLSRAVERLEGADPEVVRLGRELRAYAYIGVPLHVRGRVVGVMSFGTSDGEPCREYTEIDVLEIEEFARRVSLAVENARLFRQADELNRLKDEFLATLSHELRTPLAAVLGWARMLSAGHLDPEKASQAVQAIERSAQAQSKIVDDILDVARGMAGNLRLDMARIDLAVLVHGSVEAIAPGAAAKRIQVHVRAPAPVTVFGDAGRLQQVMWNLLSNAVKFTPPGGRVAIDVSSRDNNAVVEVADSGIGIPKAFLPFVFDKFRQADGSFTRQHGGLGLGLAIARHLVELHGGSIQACSEGEGAGASFCVSLPLPID
jgi:PAS domain S-box-containing protein